MQKEQEILFSSILISELEARIVNRLKAELLDIIQSQRPQSAEEIFTVKEACALLKISRKSLADWSKRGIINRTTINTRVRYKKSEILRVMEQKKFGRKN